MTIAAAWVRTIRDCEELIFVTDSRLSGDGRTFDACPKTITLPRGDCAIAFAGYTGHGFPFMQQLSHAIDSHSPLKRGSMDITSLKSHALKVFNGMSELINSSIYLSSPADTAPEAEFLFGGYSWIEKKFKIWSIKYSLKLRRFEARSPKCVRRIAYNGKLHLSPQLGTGDRLSGEIAFIGDQSRTAEKLLLEKLQSNSKNLNMEPFEAIRDMLRNPKHAETIGGSPQIIKVYQYMNAAPLGVYWPDKAEGTVHLHGRPCLGYERIDRWVLDPDTLWSEQPVSTENPSRIGNQVEIAK